MDRFNLELAINKLSFGNCSINILLELYKLKKDPTLMLIGGQADFGSYAGLIGNDFLEWFKSLYANSQARHNRENPTFKLWHLNGSLSSFSKDQYLFTFYELDSPTHSELNIIKNQQKVLVSSSYSKDIFESFGCKNIVHCPLGFDSLSFFDKKEKKVRDKIVFGLAGKLEKRKQHHKVLKAWTKKYGNNPNYLLNCSISNPFLSKEQQVSSIKSVLENKEYFNINFLDFIETNSLYNDYLNSNDIIIGMSAAEGWGLPEFQSVGIGKHSVILNAHSYKDWADAENSVLVNPIGKVPCYDGMFFNQGQEFNQGSYFDWDEDEFISACEEAEKRFISNPVNSSGKELVNKFTWEKTTKLILKEMGIN
jgi:glycosyltransferase involved in cell wall biosynthesis